MLSLKSNKEIAERLGVHVNTTYKYLGPQPPANRAPKSCPKAEKYAKAMKTEREEIAEASLIMEERIVKLAGMVGRYRGNENTGEVIIERTEQGLLVFRIDELNDFIRELAAIQRHMKELKPMEAW